MRMNKPPVMQAKAAPAVTSVPKFGAVKGVGPKAMGPAPAPVIKTPAAVAKPKKPFMAEKLGKGEVKHPSSHAEFMKLGS